MTKTFPLTLLNTFLGSSTNFYYFWLHNIYNSAVSSLPTVHEMLFLFVYILYLYFYIL